jgi:hypothetical protein
MNISNILTLIGLAIAVFSVIPNERRNFILPLFTKKDIGILVLLFVSCHYLMSFEWLLENWFPFLSIFTAKWGVPGATWAYPIALVFIFYPALKILPCSFTCFNSVKNTVKLYKKCLEENETDLLVKYIKYYHVNDIQKYLQSLSAFPKLSLNALDAEKEPED